jgi:hypothetical protein
LVKVSFDARRQLCLPERSRAFQRLTQILNSYLFLAGPDRYSTERVSKRPTDESAAQPLARGTVPTLRGSI